MNVRSDAVVCDDMWGPRRHRLEAVRLALSFRQDDRLVKVQEPGGAGGEARGRRGFIFSF
jgi:hypothetical protein